MFLINVLEPLQIHNLYGYYISSLLMNITKLLISLHILKREFEIKYPYGKRMAIPSSNAPSLNFKSNYVFMIYMLFHYDI